MLNNRFAVQRFFLCLYFFSMTVENFNPTGYFSIAKLTAACYLLSVLPSIKAFIFLTKKSLYFFWPILSYFLWITLISLFNVNSFSSRVLDFEVLQNILLFMVIVNHARRDSIGLDYGVLAFAVGCFCVSLLMFFNIGATESTGAVIGGEIAYRTSFFNAGPNEISIKLVTGATILIGLYFQNPLSFTKKTRLILVCWVPIILLAALKTGSRTAFLVFVLAGLFWYIVSILAAQNKLKIMVVGVVGILMLLVPLALVLPQLSAAETLIARMAETGGKSDFSQGGRFMIWAGFLSIIGDSLILGHGLSGYDQAAYEVFGAVYNPHSVFIEVMIYGGPIGLLLYLSFLIKIFLASYKMFRIRGEILPVLLLPTVLAFVIALQGLSEKTCWLLLAYIVGRFIFSVDRKRTMGLNDLR